MERQSYAKIGQNRGLPRIWIEGKYLSKFGFDPGCAITVKINDRSIVILADDDGDRVVSGRRGRSIIDMNTSKIRAVFPDDTKVAVLVQYGKISITPTGSDRDRVRPCNGKAGSLFSGGGLLDKAAVLAGFLTVFGIEVNESYADIWQENHEGRMVNACISEIAADTDRLEPVELLTGGIPCEPFSQNRRNGQELADHDLVDMTLWAGAIINQINPRTVVIEESPKYLQSDIGRAFLRMLRRMGYTVDYKYVSGLDHNELTVRKRVAIVATSNGKVVWPDEVEHTRTMGEVLHDPDDKQCQWFNRETKNWLFDHWDKQTAKGNGFASQQITPDTPAAQAITKRYFAGQGDNPVVKDVRPGRDGWFRWLTIDEVKAVMGLPPGYVLGTAKTIAGEVMGQGVLVNTFAKIIQANT